MKESRHFDPRVHLLMIPVLYGLLVDDFGVPSYLVGG